MLKTWTQINKEWFAEGSRPPKASWVELIKSGAVSGKVIACTPYIEDDHFAAQVEISATPSVEMPCLLN